MWSGLWLGLWSTLSPTRLRTGSQISSLPASPRPSRYTLWPSLFSVNSAIGPWRVAPCREKGVQPGRRITSGLSMHNRLFWRAPPVLRRSVSSYQRSATQVDIGAVGIATANDLHIPSSPSSPSRVEVNGDNTIIIKSWRTIYSWELMLEGVSV